MLTARDAPSASTMTLRVSWASGVTASEPLRRGGSGFVSPRNRPQRQIGEPHKQIRRQGVTIDVRIWGVICCWNLRSRSPAAGQTHKRCKVTPANTHTSTKTPKTWICLSLWPVYTTCVLFGRVRSSVRWMMGPLSHSKWLHKQSKWLVLMQNLWKQTFKKKNSTETPEQWLEVCEGNINYTNRSSLQAYCIIDCLFLCAN